MLSDLLNFGNLGVTLSLTTVALNLIIAFVLSLLIAWVYKTTHKGLSYSQSFVMTLVISGIVITSVMMVIGSNLVLAVGVFGAFSLIRFRTAVKDPKDMAYIFLVLSVGMAVGTHNYMIATLTTVIVLLIIYALTKINFGSIRKFDYILNFNLDTRENQEMSYKLIFDKYLKSNTVLNIKAKEQGHVLLLSFSIKFISEKDSLSFTSELEKLAGVSDVVLITAKNDIEY